MKRLFILLLLFPTWVFAQTYPSPTFNSLTLQTPLTSANGGTGVNNGSNTVTLSGNLTTSGAYPIILNATGSTSITLPASGTLLTAGSASSTYAPIASPTFTGSVTIPAGAINNTSIGATTPNAGAFTSLAASSAFTATGLVTTSDLATQGANTLLGNNTSSSASPSTVSVPSCAASGNALGWTSGSGFNCLTGYLPSVTAASTYATLGANSNITSLSGLTTTLSQAQGGTGSATLGGGSITMPFTGAVAQTLQAKTSRTINAEDFGVVGNGSTDNSAAMGLAITACVNLGGCTLHIGTTTGGSFLMNGVVVAGNNVRIVCDQGVTLLNNSTNAVTLQFGNGSTIYNYDGISGCQFAQKSGVTAASGNYALVLNGTSFFVAKSLIIMNFGSSGVNYNGISINNVYEGWFSNILVANLLNNAYTVNLGSNLYFTNVDAESNAGNGWTFSVTGGVFGTNLQAGHNNIGWIFNSGTGGPCAVTTANCNFFINGAVGDDSVSYDWEILSLIQSSLSEVWASNQQSHSTPATAAAMYLAGNNVYDDTFNQVQTYDANGDCIHVANVGGMPTSLVFNNAQLIGCGQAGTGYALNVDNAAGNVSLLGGLTYNAASGVINSGSASTVLVKNLQGYTPNFVAGSASTVSVTNNTAANLVSITVPPGTWDVTGTVQFVPAGTTVPSLYLACINTTSATCSSITSGGAESEFAATMPAGSASVLSTSPYRITVTTATTVYLVIDSTFSTNTMTANGYLRAIPVG